MNARQFLDTLLATGLISAGELAELSDSLTPVELKADAEPLARDLVRQERLTKYQAANVYRGRAKALVFGEYMVLDKIGAGGMGQVFKARHRRMKRIVALKILPPNSTKSESSVRRFYQEVEMAARLIHPNIVTAYDAGEAHGLHYLAMEFVDGRDLSSYLQKHGKLSIEQAMNCVMQAAQGLEYAHGLGIVHRDIKPSNLLVDRKAVIKILDMGLARHDSATAEKAGQAEGLTMAGEVLGTLDFMAPEQAHDSRQADARADIYSLGCTLFRLLTNQPPYQGDTPVKKLFAHRDHPIPSLRKFRPEVPYKLDVLFQQMLAKDPAKRPQSMSQVLVALKALLSGASEEESSISVLSEVPVAAAEDLGSFLSKAAEQSGPIGRGPGSSLNLGAPVESPMSELTPTLRGDGSTRRHRRSKSKPPPPAWKRSLSNPVVAALGGAGILLVVALLGWAIFGRSSSGPDATELANTTNRTKPPAKPLVKPPAKPIVTPPVVTPVANPPVAEITYGPGVRSPPTAAPPVASSGKPIKPAAKPPMPATTVASNAKPPAPPPASKAPVTIIPPTTTLAATVTPVSAPPATAVATTTPPTAPASKPVSVPKVKPHSPTLPVTEAIDLTKLLDLKRDTLEDRWTLEEGVLTRHGLKTGRLEIPFTPPSAYDLTVVFDRKSGDKAFSIGLYVDGYQASLNLTPKDCSIDPPLLTLLTKRPLQETATGSPTTVVCSVRGNRIYATINGAPALDWSGEPKDLYTTWSMPNKHQLFLAVAGTGDEIHISKLEIAPPTHVVPNYQRIDLLASIDPARDKASGELEVVHGDLLLPPTSDSNGASLGLAIQRPNEYVFTAIVERTDGQADFSMALPLATTRVGAVMDRGESKEAGLWYTSAGYRVHPDQLSLPPWQQHTIICTLFHDHLSMSIDGRSMADSEDFKLDSVTQLTELKFSLPYAFLLHAKNSSGFRISRLEMTPRDWRPLPVPVGDALAAAQKSCQPLVSTARDLSSKAEKKPGGVQQLWRQAVEMPDDAARRYVLLDAAAHLAADAADLQLVCRSLIELDRTFAGDHRKLHESLLSDMFKAARTAGQKQTLATEALRQMDGARAIEDFDLALSLQSAAIALKPLPPDLAKELKARGIEFAFWRDQRDANDKALVQLASTSSAPAAQVIAGRYLALVRGDWNAAAKYLEGSGDAALLAAVRAELNGPRLPDDQVAAGERWWALSEKAAAPLKWAYLERAAVWYRRASGRATGKAHSTIEQHGRVLAAQRKLSSFAFARRHPLDAARVGDHWFKRYATPMHWRTAQAVCEDVGGALPMLKTEGENQALAQFLAAAAKSEEKMNCWLGATDEGQEGTFRWLDETPVAAPYFTNWRTGEPNNNAGDEDFVSFEVWLEQGEVKTAWNDWSGKTNYPLVCQWDF